MADRLMTLIIGDFLPNISPDLQAMLQQALDGLEAQAKRTSSLWDDVFVRALRTLLGL